MEWGFYSNYFVSTRNDPFLPVAWVTPVYPKRRTPFVVQLLLAFGHFETECELMITGSMKQACIKAGLCDPSNGEESINNLLKRCVNEMSRLIPGSYYQFDRNLVQAHHNLRSILLDVDKEEEITPAVLCNHIHEQTTSKITDYIRGEKD